MEFCCHNRHHLFTGSSVIISILQKYSQKELYLRWPFHQKKRKKLSKINEIMTLPI